MLLVPVSNLLISNTPIGPFQMMVFEPRITCPGTAPRADVRNRPVRNRPTAATPRASDTGGGLHGETSKEKTLVLLRMRTAADR